MNVIELIEKLKLLPAGAEVEATPSGCCGCAQTKVVDIEFDGETVFIDGSHWMDG